MNKFILMVTGVFMMGLSFNAISQTAGFSGVTVKSIVVDSEAFGGCMILVDKVLSSKGLDCPNNWVSFSCFGNFNPKDLAYRKLDQAQMSMALNKTVFVVVDDTKKHNGLCFVKRIDINK